MCINFYKKHFVDTLLMAECIVLQKLQLSTFIKNFKEFVQILVYVFLMRIKASTNRLLSRIYIYTDINKLLNYIVYPQKMGKLILFIF